MIGRVTHLRQPRTQSISQKHGPVWHRNPEQSKLSSLVTSSAFVLPRERQVYDHLPTSISWILTIARATERRRDLEEDGAS